MAVNAERFPILTGLQSPHDISRMGDDQLEALAAEMREAIIDTVSQTGGHLGASLGTVELTIALHAEMDSPTDRIVWDVGHQAYGHKLLTGRLDGFPTLRQHGGISGFLSRKESEHDVMGAGHASTSISYATGLAEAHRHGRSAPRHGCPGLGARRRQGSQVGQAVVQLGGRSGQEEGNQDARRFVRRRRPQQLARRP